MTKKRKLLIKIMRGSKNVRFDEFVTLVEGFGFSLDRISGSHHIYEHPNVPQGISLQPDKHDQVEPYQMKQFLKLVEKYNLELEDDIDDEDEQAGDDQ